MPAHPSPYLTALTGRTNHRRNWLGQMVLQVEYEAKVGHGGRPQLNKPTYITELRWRDAKPQDIHLLDWFARTLPNPRKKMPPHEQRELEDWLGL